MTMCDYRVVMKSVGTADLKAHLSEYLRVVRQGQTITVLDGRQPIARLIPIDDVAQGLVVRRPAGSLHDIPLPGPTRASEDVLDDLLAERGDRRRPSRRG